MQENTTPIKRVRLADLSLQPLRIPTGWAVVSNQFYQLRPEDTCFVEGVLAGNMWELFEEDLLLLRHTVHEVMVDLGWYPEADPDGTFRVQVVFDEDWQHPPATFETRNLDELVAHLEAFLHQAPAGAFGKPPLRSRKRAR